MREHISKSHIQPETSCSVSKGVYATLILPCFIAFTSTTALFGVILELTTGDESNRIAMIATIVVLLLPMILALSIGMLWTLKNVTQRLIKISHYKRIGFGAIIGLWISSLSKLHLLWLGFYLCLGLIWLVVIQFIPLDQVYGEIFNEIGLPVQTGLTFILLGGLLAYLALFGGMAYVLGTLPLALISAVIFRYFTKIQRPA